MIISRKRKLKYQTALFVLFFVLSAVFTACDLPMGLGPPVDLEATKIRVLKVELADGTEIPIQVGDNKLFIGRGILVGAGAVLYGEAWDNELVEEVYIEEIGANRTLINGVSPHWSARISSEKDSDGWQKWSIPLEGLQGGERVISITAFDKPRNIGPESVEQLTLLVDTNYPIVESIVVERAPGKHVGLLPREILAGFVSDFDDYDTIIDSINYFQNESFTIRAHIEHGFSLSHVYMNLIDEQGNRIFSQDKEFIGTFLYTPVWTITHDDLVNANSKYASGPHFMNVVITATATAGHSNEQEDIENILYSLLWYPESDFPRIETSPLINGTIIVNKGEVIPIKVFDDDEAAEIYAGLISQTRWNGIDGVTDEEKLKWLKNNHLSFEDELGVKILKDNRLASPVFTTVSVLNADKSRGMYRLVTLVKDIKYLGTPAGVWSLKADIVSIMEDSVPMISVSDPRENSSPALTNNKFFDIEGVIINMDPVEFIRIAWIPFGANLSAADQITFGEDILINNNPRDGAKIWERTSVDGELEESIQTIGGKPLTNQRFSFTFDVFEDFKYNGILENEIKVFMLYTKSRGEEAENVFYTLSLMPYKQPPVIHILRPSNWAAFGSGAEIHFDIYPESLSGLDIEEVTLYSQAAGENLTLTKVQRPWDNKLVDVWIATDNPTDMGDYQYEINVKDALGNEEHSDLFIKVEALPKLSRITTSHNQNAEFSSFDRIIIQAVFERAVNTVNTVDGTPRIRLTGFNPDPGETRYAYYTSGLGSNTLNFTYDIQSGDNADVLMADYFDINNSDVSADIQSGPLSSAITQTLTNRALKVRGISPKITDVKVKKDEDSNLYFDNNYAWHREGQVITIEITLDKEVRVLGSPRLILPFDGGTGVNRHATFQTTALNDTVMIFTYKVQDGDNYDLQNLRIITESCFSSDHLSVITDKVGSQGNELALGTSYVNQSSNVRIDAIKPTPLCVQLLPNPGSDPVISQRFIVTEACNCPVNTKGHGTHIAETHQGTQYQYTINGVQWNDISTLPFERVVTDPTFYEVSARQIDRAGNEGEEFPFETFSLSSFSQLVSIVCDNPDGTYNGGSILNFKLIFSGPVYSNGNGSVNFNVGTGSNTTVVSRPIQTVTSANASFSLSFSWTVDDNRRMEPVTITSINLTGVNRVVGQPFISDGDNDDKVSARVNAYNSSRPNLRVLSIRPTITGGSPVSNAIITPNGDYSTITLVFSGSVEPERGYIRIKPTATANGASGVTTGNWLIPPVLTNEEFARISNALPAVSRPSLTNNDAASYYIRTTHGIKLNEAGTRYVPDTDTKYVLNFESGIDNGTLRPLLNTAKFLWQEIEVVSDRVTVSGNTVSVQLDALPPGRQWKVEIDADSFRDSASNYFEGWGTEQHVNRWFWSQQTATPVIRVERVSNNSPRISSTPLSTLQTNVRYRIDTVTPGAVILRGEYNASNSVPAENADIDTLRGLNGGIARITSGAMPNQGASDPYRANAAIGHLGNSNIPDATVAAITANTAGNLVIGTSYVMGNYINLGGRMLGLPPEGEERNAALYTARKDYVGATASHTSLTPSARGYEGIFKTVVVYRDVGTQVTTNQGRSLKIEATNTLNGAVTIAGFPMWYNDMTGHGSKYMLRNGNDPANDWIFITWEIVSEFWQVTPVTRDETNILPGALWNAGTGSNSWQSFSANYQVHNYRSYGNWGMQRGNR